METELKKKELLLLQTRIGDLPISEKLLNGCTAMGFGTLQEIIDLGWGKLINKKEFTYRWFTEMTTFLKNQQILHLLQACPNPLADDH